MSTGPFRRELHIVNVEHVERDPYAIRVVLSGMPTQHDVRNLAELLASPLCFRVDRERDLVHIGGIQYSGELFREFGFKAAVGQLLRIEERQRGVLSVSRAQAPAQATLLQALRFYARRKHLVIDEEHQEMDQVSGEPANWLCSHREGDTTMLEDGSIARMALRGEQVHWGDLGEASAPQPLDAEAYTAQADKPKPLYDRFALLLDDLRTFLTEQAEEQGRRGNDSEAAGREAQAFGLGELLTILRAIDPPTRAAKEVLAERQRQISAEGWTPEHDDEHSGGELAVAAACYADTQRQAGMCPGRWPRAAEWWKPSSRRHDLIKAGALILAEIERLDRQSKTSRESRQ